jgi:hypothetical protein
MAKRRRIDKYNGQKKNDRQIQWLKEEYNCKKKKDRQIQWLNEEG